MLNYQTLLLNTFSLKETFKNFSPSKYIKFYNLLYTITFKTKRREAISLVKRNVKFFYSLIKFFFDIFVLRIKENIKRKENIISKEKM